MRIINTQPGQPRSRRKYHPAKTKQSLNGSEEKHTRVREYYLGEKKYSFTWSNLDRRKASIIFPVGLVEEARRNKNAGR